MIHHNLTLLCSSRMTYQVLCTSTPYSRCFDRFMWLFHHCIMFYGQNYPKIGQSWSWCSRSRYKFMIKILILYVHCALCVMCGDVSRPYRRCLVSFMWLFHHCITFYGRNYPKIGSKLIVSINRSYSKENMSYTVSFLITPPGWHT